MYFVLHAAMVTCAVHRTIEVRIPHSVALRPSSSQPSIV